jgi:hypothetical protein
MFRMAIFLLLALLLIPLTGGGCETSRYTRDEAIAKTKAYILSQGDPDSYTVQKFLSGEWSAAYQGSGIWQVRGPRWRGKTTLWRLYEDSDAVIANNPAAQEVLFLFRAHLENEVNF